MEITMAWTELTRRQYDRQGTKYASDTSDAEWALTAPLMPPPKTTGRPRTTCLRDVIDALLYIATTGCQWRMLPNDFPPISTVRPSAASVSVGRRVPFRKNLNLCSMSPQYVLVNRLRLQRSDTKSLREGLFVKT